ncbi:hypothetical protein HG535_0C01800 [Zygotorulaspora mrakii]|uniref:Nitrogen regulatory protein areA GATA-like domain-containing protein n=1 Tax=Zygotorulaspora mrakii TaxID=42260 RepID=A0A7H9AZP4_ZYGMR|nr:uncharacterized protein HG535_0C01800 [Zygotorulaspora mrakii]QLG71831.1 hypothetical protein HG535_0C01800 [Zygotorulaspora mrakii]
MASNLAAYFAEQSQKQQSSKLNNSTDKKDGGTDDMGPSTSMAVEAADDDSFERSTYNLKRTRSMGLLDDYIDPTKKLLGKTDNEVNKKNDSTNAATNDNDEDNDNGKGKGKAKDINGKGKSKDKDNEKYKGKDKDEHKYDDTHGVENKDTDKFLEKNNSKYEYEDDYNSDSNSLDSEESDESDNESEDDRYDYGNDEDYQDDGLQRYESYSRQDSSSSSVSPPPADNDNFLMPQDDNDLFEEPERHVDYLSHDWNESEISSSWKYIILKKKKKNEDLVNAARLENASWRTWAKARNHLKTVSPEVVNWSKDSDVTWLYGPIIRGTDNGAGEYVEIGYGSDDETSKRLTTKKSRKKKSKSSNSSSSSSTASATPKPILKKRSVTEIIKENSLWKLNEARKHINDLRYASTRHMRDDYDDYDALAAKVNAQYYQTPNKDQDSNEYKQNMERSQIIDVKSGKITADSDVPKNDSSNALHQITSRDPSIRGSDHFENENQAKEDTAPSGILNSPNHSKDVSNSGKIQKDRHIHFNDRVEQCMAIGRTFSNSDSSDDEDYGENTYAAQQNGTGTFFSSDDQLRSGAAAHVEDRSASSSDNDQDEDDDEDDNAGLFINPTMSRRADSNAHYSATDTSSQSSAQSKLGLDPIIKLLPATTLNYGSDDEASDNSDFNGSYGNAISHNVNTYRGYDYMYDYNSVYTGDTSNFLPVDNCDVVDLPEGLNLHSAMASDTASNYELNHSISSTNGSGLSGQSTSHNRDSMYHDTDSDSLNSGDEFIENSVEKSSDDDNYDDGDDNDGDEKPADDSAVHQEEKDGRSDQAKDKEDDSNSLKRTVSFGKNNSCSAKDLRKQPSNTSLKPPTTRSFISGQPLVTSNNSKSSPSHSNETSRPKISSVHSSSSSTSSRPRFVKRNSSSSNFIFLSDSDDSNDEDDGNESLEENQVSDYDSSLRYNKLPNSDEVTHISSSLPALKDNSKNAAPQSTTIKPALDSNAPSTSPLSSDLSKIIRIKNSSSPPEAKSSDVAISGSFSPLYDSVKSITAKKGILNKGNATDLHEMNKNLEDYHIDENSNERSPANVNTNQGSTESVHKMMQNARDIAQKYLHSWKKVDGKQEDTRKDVLNHR